ncbi:hypothetical protein MPTK1_1g12230 [Marchantia polymorpha subsp. ruderalis]|uniref:Uncharacterized protein n=2 Tax=Marchantia polymorpha TaxID=3197 RepID=A0AAF6APB0_MARPO|nr:hypothetical protein MARPO_0014s0005 [Marchantia polymorpha]PTQ45440.1 hypothetical protein MARPO_0014s0005 [Marchantia polymorpha]BBM98279.1 hypothetical protein Mp_1g12230 [Marchantia polymorpha subsp. ruderalis]BBM98280.1 hypothetical protein Mp_1g12230 [Marchantia polymorpha subsp. ruderalis]|eukprot:PTQ45439.1 hypothetical protein MARPO_0014s0005 [Marchantia polymorpha]
MQPLPMCSWRSLSLNSVSGTRSQAVLPWRLTQRVGGAGCRVVLVIAIDVAIQLHRFVVNADGCTTSCLTVPNHIINPAVTNVNSYTKARGCILGPVTVTGKDWTKLRSDGGGNASKL